MSTIFTYTVPTKLNLNPRRDPDITVSSQLNPGGNTSDFWIGNDGEPQFAQIEIDDPVTGFKMFRGTVSQYTDEFEEQVTQAKHEITGIGPSWIFNKKRPFGSFTNVSLTTVINSLVTAYAPDFTLNHLQTGLPTITIVFTGEELLMDAITRAVQAAGNCRWYLDYNYDVHCYYVGSPALPTPITRPGPTGSARPAVSTSNVAMVVSQYVGTSFSSTPGAHLFSYVWEYDDGELSAYSPWCAIAYDGATQINLSNITAGPTVSGHVVVARRIYFALISNTFGASSGTPPDSRNFQPYSFVRIPDNTTTSISLPYEFQNLGTPPQWCGLFDYAFAPNAGFPVPQPATTPPAPGGAPTVANGSAIPGGLTYTPGHTVFAYSFLYEDGSESAISPSSSGFVTDGTHAPEVTIAVGTTFGSIQCIARKIYWAFAYSGTPTFDPQFYPSGYMVVPDNTSTVVGWDNTYGFINPQFGSFSLAFYGVPLTTPALGPNPELDGLNPDDILDGDVNLMKDPPMIVTYDASQIRNRVFIRGAGSNITTDANVGATIIQLPLGHPFSATGGYVFIKSHVYQYSAATTTSITLTSGLVENIRVANGDFAALWYQADDSDAQNWLATQEDGDGIHEYTIVDTSLATIYDMSRRAQAELAMFARAIVTVQYTTRDVKSLPGRSVVINLTNPPVSGTFIIQTVKTDQIDYTTDNTLLPRFQVTASNVRWTLDDFFRNVALISAGGGGGSSGTGTATGGSGTSGPGTTVGGTNVYGEVPGGTVNGSNVNFTTANVFFTGSLRVFINGLRQKGNGIDYTEVTGGFTAITAPQTGDLLVVDYVH